MLHMCKQTRVLRREGPPRLCLHASGRVYFARDVLARAGNFIRWAN